MQGRKKKFPMNLSEKRKKWKSKIIFFTKGMLTPLSRTLWILLVFKLHNKFPNKKKNIYGT